MSIKGTYKNIAPTSGQFLPEGVKEGADDLIEILEGYYKWADKDGNFQKESKLLADSFSYTTASDNYIPVFKDTLLRLFPDKHKSITKHLLKFSKAFYAERGTPESYEFLFKAIWGEDVTINNPSDFILRSSDGIWISKKIMRIDNVDFNIDNCNIHGKTSKARAYITEYVIHKEYTELVLENISKSFYDEEIIEFYKPNNADSIGKSRTILSITGYDIINPGKGYSPGQEVSMIAPGDGHGFKIKISAVNSLDGSIIAFDILNQGAGYINSLPTLDLTNPYLFAPDAKIASDTKVEFSKEFAVVKLTQSSMYDSPGYYETPKSLLSDNWKLFDGEYYQEFSYEIETELDINVFYDTVMTLLHPAGSAMFYKKINNAQSADITLYNKTDFDVTSEYIKDTKLRYSMPDTILPRYGRAAAIYGENIEYEAYTGVENLNVSRYNDPNAIYS